MNAPQPTGGKPDRPPSEPTIQELLDALASGRCDSVTFLNSLRGPVGPDSTGNWELLSQVDQYYRRGKIPKELFQEIRMGLAQFALGLRSDETASPRPEVRAAQAPSQPHVRPIAAAPDAATVTAPAGPRDARPDAKKTAASEAAREIGVGDVLRNRYRIVGILGQGGMGTVYEADDNYRLDIPPTGQGLAIKVLHTAVTKRAELFSELRREFQHLQSLSHPNIVRAYEFDRDGPVAFFTMELLSGSLLSQLLLARNRIRLETAEAWAIVRDVGSAIAHAHSRNVVHGDINPQNIFITQRGNVRVLDFGASHALSNFGRTGEVDSASFATPGYVSCQVLQGERPDASDDVFALACVSYLLLSGVHPFKNHTAIEARARSIKPKRLPGLHWRQWRALRAGLQWDREKRPSDVAAWLYALDLQAAAPRLRPLAELIDNPVPPRRRFGFAVAASAAAVAVLAIGFWIATHFAELSTRLAALVDQTVPIRTAEPIAAPPSAAVKPVAASPPVASQPRALPQAAAPPAAPPTATPTAPPVSTPTAAQSAAPPAVAQRATSPPAATRSSISQIELAADTVDVPLHEPSASVLVHRKGNLRGKVGFTWWTESGTAKPVTDFAPVAPHVEYFEEGKATVTLSIRLADTVHARDRSFYVVIDQPEEGTTLGPRALTMITLPGNQSDK
jgi:tRNA A-37 threonylcarbamoyl transferase component Bud32